jgi:phosphoglycerol transferase MdoB-like AlkP superfamily enzyme
MDNAKNHNPAPLVAGTPDTFKSPSGLFPLYTLAGELKFILQIFILWMLLFFFFRAGLLLSNSHLFSAVPAKTLLLSFLVGCRFDCLVTCQLVLPLLAWLLIPMFGWQYSPRMLRWLPPLLIVLWSPLLFLSLAEWQFYGEFQDRFNNLAIQYLNESPSIVLSMLWHGFPLARYACIWLLMAGLLYYCLKLLLRRSGLPGTFTWKRYTARVLPAGLLLTIFLVIGARGTLRQGPPLRWGDAYFSDYAAANQLALNGIFTLSRTIEQRSRNSRASAWMKTMPADRALAVTRDLVLQPGDRLLAPAEYPLLRVPGEGPRAVQFSPRPRNLVIILMESFLGEFVGALGAPYNATPCFDQLSKKGMLFDHFFSQGTHTHQGLFATLCSVPNLPGFEFLMSDTAGNQPFRSLPAILIEQGYQTVYVYNGSPTWDNQEGFFRNQGMSHFVGREDYINPLHNDPTWGVSDEDMFMRAAVEMDRLCAKGPAFALLQTLSNHAPFNLPPPAPFNDISGPRHLLPRLNGLRYADWALGKFFDSASQKPWFRETLFVVLADHGFAFEPKQADIDLDEYHIPLLIYYPGDTRYAGRRIHTVGSQVDVLPTSLGLLEVRYAGQSWGRDLFRLDARDRGWAVIKPAGSSQKAALIHDDSLLILKPGFNPELYKFELNPWHAVKTSGQTGIVSSLSRNASAYLQTAIAALITKHAGITPQKIRDLTITSQLLQPHDAGAAVKAE